MSSYDAPHWSEVRDEDSPLERERNERDLLDAEHEARADMMGQRACDGAPNFSALARALLAKTERKAA